MSELVPVLWICGPPGVGKSAVGCDLYTQLVGAGVHVGYVDLDQLGMCYPEPANDPGRHRMQAANLAAVVATYTAAGAACVVVSGLLDPHHDEPVSPLPRSAVTVCRLRADADVLRARFAGRGAQVELVEEVLREAAALDGSDVADVCVDTTGLPVDEVVRQVRTHLGEWPAPDARASRADLAPRRISHAPGPVLWVCGATGVGKSTVGWQLFEHARATGVPAAFVDLDQLGHLRVGGTGPAVHQVRADNLAAVWDTFHANGARCLVVNGPVDDPDAVRTYANALPAATLTVCRLHAGREELTRRIQARGQGGSWWQPGDPLRGQPDSVLRQVAADAARVATGLEQAEVGDHRIDTDGRTVDEVVQAVLASTGGRPATA
ncbi:AAA domain-containing protein [Actinopolymorpha cephalotaxi]|uniref:AAA domain-containing protein n=1 Tax=Actinopolymorpha cephalotaxi TaxID=504797 RepID=A0A1I2LCW3_9ACTN|nr:AAA family ATPase [Actinopolymorpha cephalotaxi]NYH84983.1 adenylylsulfate kinase-like enzyme [Actinopolymorpha cephalotaxi]SFF76368.1 AAA domain-containing protein [Actinopolymorpha cephalotaxi]